MFNMSGQPAMSVPLAWNKAGLPLGMMFSAKFGDEGDPVPPGRPTRAGAALEEQITAGMRVAVAAKMPGLDKTQPYSAARKRHRAATGTPIPQTELDPEAESWLKATRPTTRWRPSPAFSISRKPIASRKSLRSPRKGPWPSAHPRRPSAHRGSWLLQNRSRPDGRDPFQMDGAPRQWRLLCRRDHRREFSADRHRTAARDAAIQMVDDRESDARRRFEQLKSEMTGRGAAANLVRKDSGEA